VHEVGTVKRVRAKIPRKQDGRRNNGGYQPGAGRPPGRIEATGKTLKAIRRWAIESGELPHVFLLRVMRGEKIDGIQPSFEMRIDAAKAACTYFVPRLSSVAVTDEDGKPLQTQQLVLDANILSRLTDPELEAFKFLFDKLTGKLVEGRLAPTMDGPLKPYTRTINPGSESVH
jgi:hypothetical protein